MPTSRQSLKLTEAYRAKLTALSKDVQREGRASWSRLDWDDLNGSYEPIKQRLVTAVEYAQGEGVRLTAGYVGAFVASELGVAVATPALRTGAYVGRSFGGKRLDEALESPLIATLAAIRDGSRNPLRIGLRELLANLDLHVKDAPRRALVDAIEADERCDGWQRAVKGTCAACAAKAGSDGHTQFPVHPHCFPAGTEVSGPPVRAATTRWYCGDLVELRLSRKTFLAVTPNHPILTRRGWVAAGELSEADYVIRGGDGQRMAGGPDDHEGPALIEQVAEALGSSRGGSSASVPVTPVDFHGDGTGGDVDVVWTDGPLQHDRFEASDQHIGQLALCGSCSDLFVLAGSRDPAEVFEGVGGSASSALSRREQLAILNRRAPSGGDAISIPASANLNASVFEFTANAGAAGSVPSSERLRRHAGEVHADQLVATRRYPFRGHVYNLQTEGGWYSANGVIVHNCQCVGEPRVTGGTNRYRRRDANQRFDEMSFEQQNDTFGFDAAQLLRDKRVDILDFAAAEGKFLTTRALKDIKVKAESPLSFEERIDRVAKGIDPDKPNQPFDTIDEVFDHAKRTEQEYRELVNLGNELQRRLGADALVGDDLAAFEEAAAKLTAKDRTQIVIAPLKRRATAEAKLKRKKYGPEGLSDLNRGSIIVKDIDDIPGVLAELRRATNERGWSMSEVDDGFSGEGVLGYRDLAVNLRSPSGHVTEMQIHVDSLWTAKFRPGGGHKLYEEMRTFDELKYERALTGPEKAALRRLRERSVNLYNEALTPKQRSVVHPRGPQPDELTGPGPTPPKPSLVVVSPEPAPSLVPTGRGVPLMTRSTGANGASTAARVEEMSVGETETLILGPTNRAKRQVLDGWTETRFQHAARDTNGEIVWNRNQHLFDQRWDTPVWSASRKRLHEKIVKQFLSGEVREEGIGVPRRVAEPRLVSTAGGGASGKSSMIRAGAVDFGDDGAVTVANDLIKEQLPEYLKMVAMKDPWAANAVNEESAYIAKMIAENAVKQGFNVLLDIVGDGPAGVFAQSIRGFEAAGYSLEIDYASCPLALAQKRALARQAKTGRRADPDALAYAHQSAATRFHEVNALDKATVRVYDTTTTGPEPLLVYEKVRGRKGRVLDKAGWKRWLEKADEGVTLQQRSLGESALQSTPLTRDLVEEVQDAIAAAHRVPGSILRHDPVEVRARELSGGADGEYHYNLLGLNPPTITVSPTSGNPALSLAHEFGHHFDRVGGGERGFSSLTNPELDAWRAAVEDTKLVRELRDGQRTGKVHARFADGSEQTMDVSPAVNGMLDYLLEPRELWARSYSQWVGLRSGKFNAKFRGDRLVDQWDDDDFAPIAKALDDYFEKRGLRERTEPSTGSAAPTADEVLASRSTRIGDVLEGDDAVNHLADRMPAERYVDAVQKYQYGGSEGAQTLNRYLRGAMSMDSPERRSYGLRADAHRDELDAMLEANGPLGARVVTWRGLPGRPEDYGFAKGKTLVEKGYSSVSADRSVAAEFANYRAGVPPGGEGGFIVKTTIHPNVRASYLGSNMSELLVERNVRYVVTESDEHSVSVTILPPAEETLASRSFRAPATYQEVDDRGFGRWTNGAPKMSAKEQVALHDYVSPSRYINLQTYFRDPKKFERLTAQQLAGEGVTVGRHPARVIELRKLTAERAEYLRAAIEKYGKSWRGDEMYRRTLVSEELLAAVEAGEAREFVEPGFLSVGKNLDEVNTVVRETHKRNFSKTVILKVRVTSDRPGVSPTDAGLHTFEEIVFGPGTRLRFLRRINPNIDPPEYEVELI